MHDFTYDEVVAKADSIKAVLGASPVVYLRNEVSPPFAKACEFEAGSTFRLGVSTSGYFTAVVKGIRCRWSFDLEGWGANGTGHLQPRIEAIRHVIGKLEGKARNDFRAWLIEVANKVRTDATELRAYADDQIAKAATLGPLVATIGRIAA